jgi:hypothetical protein
MSATTKGISASQASVRCGIREITARLFMYQIRETMKSNENYLVDGILPIDEFVVGGKEENKPGRSYDSKKKKAVCVIQLTDDGKVKRFYAMKIKDFSAKSIKTIFVKHISKKAKINIDEWKGYKPLIK